MDGISEFDLLIALAAEIDAHRVALANLTGKGEPTNEIPRGERSMNEIDPLRPAESTGHDEDVFLMANVFPESSGLPFVVWISEGAMEKMPCENRTCASRSPKARKMSLTFPSPSGLKYEVIKGSMSPSDLSSLTAWIERNRQTIIQYWGSDISTGDALARLVKI